ncbi:MAG: cbb3-type cytochrome oxidase assembly protein CcoS [SAR324 cluster bacterium]|nr:cbb3-type cytochrome oxidase assembly protein CcoS [SAR324 cluster bacterium]
MSIIYVLIPTSLLLGGGALIWFILALRSGQFDDLETPAYRILFDEEGPNNH